MAAIDATYLETVMVTDKAIDPRTMIDLTNDIDDLAAVAIDPVRFETCATLGINMYRSRSGMIPDTAYATDIDGCIAFTMYYLWRDRNKVWGSRWYQDGLMLAKEAQQHGALRQAASTGTDERNFTNPTQTARALPSGVRRPEIT